METLELKSGYAADRAKPARAFRTIGRAEAATLRGSVGVIDRNGNVRNAQVTTVKTWKRRVDVEVHLKYGMYEYFTTTYTETGVVGPTLVLPL